MANGRGPDAGDDEFFARNLAEANRGSGDRSTARGDIACQEDLQRQYEQRQAAAAAATYVSPFRGDYAAQDQATHAYLAESARDAAEAARTREQEAKNLAGFQYAMQAASEARRREVEARYIREGKLRDPKQNFLNQKKSLMNTLVNGESVFKTDFKCRLRAALIKNINQFGNDYRSVQVLLVVAGSINRRYEDLDSVDVVFSTKEYRSLEQELITFEKMSALPQLENRSLQLPYERRKSSLQTNIRYFYDLIEKEGKAYPFSAQQQVERVHRSPTSAGRHLQRPSAAAVAAAIAAAQPAPVAVERVAPHAQPQRVIR